MAVGGPVDASTANRSPVPPSSKGSDIDIVERNYRTASGEIDIVAATPAR